MRGEDVRLRYVALCEGVGERLTLTRETFGQRSVDWAKRYKVSMGKLSNWEAGRNLPDMIFMISVCEDYGLPLDWFYRALLPQTKAAVRLASRLNAELSSASISAESDMELTVQAVPPDGSA